MSVTYGIIFTMTPPSVEKSRVMLKVLMYFHTVKLHQTGTFIKHTCIGFLQTVPHIGDNKGVYMDDLDVIHMPDESEFLS